ncbi:hypothetical protein AGR7A_Lc120596 [Agrobacterium deltaense NCPPB 1641]|uniref:Uncharacterized protein n=1 Tax=Agrobacterium deltaense NCPPB 1641 TaxID=1183425 RepID=A0A1S7TY81_9HYPH|nr:hypothetical protein AGR7A_Lc120596 [Agrobacterium deltaense NCPPB 1641]
MTNLETVRLEQVDYKLLIKSKFQPTAAAGN